MNSSQVTRFLACLSTINDSDFRAEHIKSSDHFEERNHDHDHEHDHDEESTSKDILIAKATAMIVLFCASTICGSVPFLLDHYFKWTERRVEARSALIVQCLLYFGGGVLLSTTFLHLLPEVQANVESMQNCGIFTEVQFALAELLMCTGFFFMYLVEETIHSIINHKRKSIDKDKACAAFERGHSVRNSFLVTRANNNHLPKSEETIRKEELGEKALTNSEKVSSEQNSSSTIEIANAENGSRREHSSCEPHSHHHSHLHLSDADGMLTASIRGLLIVLALSLHELFEGMAIGLETQSAAAVWFMFGAVSAHKLVLAFCVGVELIVARTRTLLAIIYVITFAIVSPIGIGTGILLSVGSGSSAAPSIPAAILQGFACGTLLYVVFFEILSKDHSGLRTYLALVVGFVVMFGLQQIGAGNHGHSHAQGCSDANSDHDHNNDVRSMLLKHENKNNLAEEIRSLLKYQASAINAKHEEFGP